MPRCRPQATKERRKYGKLRRKLEKCWRRIVKIEHLGEATKSRCCRR